MVKPNRWVVTAGIFAAFAIITYRVVEEFNKAWDIW